MLNTITLREDGHTTNDLDVDSDYRENIVGWFSNKYNPAFGWVVCTLSNFDKKWIENKGVNSFNVYRTYSASGSTSLVKLNTTTGTHAFVDNIHLEETDVLKFEKAVKFRQLFIDDTPQAKDAFLITKRS